MADDFPEGLPAGWFLDHKVRRDGTVKRFYHNIETGQRFNTKEEMARFANYHNMRARFDVFRACYEDEDGQFLDRPWETDPHFTFNDYVDGKVGKVKELKDKAASGSSAPAIASDSASSAIAPDSASPAIAPAEAKLPEKAPKKGKGKGKGKGGKK